MHRPKTKAEREAEREAALQRQEEMLSGGSNLRPSIRAADLPDQIERPRANKVFLCIGVALITLLIIALFVTLRSDAKRSERIPSVQTQEME